MKTPGPDHPITVQANPKRVRVRFQNHVFADTAQALVLQEASYPAVQYFPRQDVDTAFLSKSATVTTCPCKGQATYYSMLMNGDLVEDVAWSYEDPYPAMEQIRGHLAFYPDKVEVYEIDEASLDDRRRPEAAASWPTAR